MLNERVRASLTKFSAPFDTDEGVRLETHCLYPSFDPVIIYVAKVGDGYKVSDGAGALRRRGTMVAITV